MDGCIDLKRLSAELNTNDDLTDEAADFINRVIYASSCYLISKPSCGLNAGLSKRNLLP